MNEVFLVRDVLDWHDQDCQVLEGNADLFHQLDRDNPCLCCAIPCAAEEGNNSSDASSSWNVELVSKEEDGQHGTFRISLRD
ncbi:MAG: hypothetical protein WC341_13840 [Bacteroidales bacterium]|jgi:hypothetical protein